MLVLKTVLVVSSYSRRTRPLSNGTSDGEEHSTQDSDLQSSTTSSKLAALTRAIELVPTVHPSADSKEDEETLQVRFSFVYTF